MNWKPIVFGILGFIGVGGVGYLIQLVHADEHVSDRNKLGQLEVQTSSLLQVINSNMLTEELMRAARLRTELEDSDDPNKLRRLIETEQNIDRLRKSLEK